MTAGSGQDQAADDDRVEQRRRGQSEAELAQHPVGVTSTRLMLGGAHVLVAAIIIPVVTRRLAGTGANPQLGP